MPQEYDDNDFVYVDPGTRTVLGKVEWKSEGIVKPLPVPEREEAPAKEGDKPRRKRKKQQFCVWGTYGSLKYTYKLDGRHDEESTQLKFDEALKKFQEDPLSV